MLHTHLGLLANVSMALWKSNPDQFIICMLCTRPLKEPQLLSCGQRGDKHAFCRQCLHEYLKHDASVDHNDQKESGDLYCPTCVSLTNVRGITESYPPNHNAKQMNSYIKLRSAEDDYREVCSQCTKPSASSGSKVKKYCSNCRKELCSKCSEKHRDQNHALLALRDNYHLLCKEHKDHMTGVCVKCRNHVHKDRLICDKCSEHMSSSEETPKHQVVPLAEHLGRKRQALWDDLKKLNAEMELKDIQYTQLKTLSTEQEQQRKKVEQDIDRRAYFMKREIETNQKKLKDNLQLLYADKKKRLQNQMEYLQFHKTAVHRLIGLIEQLNKDGQDFHLLANYEELRLRCHNATSHSTTASSIGNITEPALAIARQSFQLETKNDTSLGEIVNKPLPMPTPVGVNPQRAIMPDLKTDPTLVVKINDPAKSSVCYNPKLKPRGLTFLPDGSVVLAFSDAEYLQMYNKSGQLVSTITDNHARIFPNDITYAGNNQLVISDGNSNQLKIFKVPEERERESKQTPRTLEHRFHEPFGVACHHGTKDTIVVSDVMKHNITVIDMVTGRSLKSWGKYGSKPTEFNCPEYLAVDSQNIVWVSDRYNNCIKAFNFSGKLLQTLGNSSTLNQPGGIAVDHHGYILVADGGNHRILIYAKDGSSVKVLLNAHDQEIFWPYGLSISGEGVIGLTRREDTLVVLYRAYMDKFD